MSEPSLDEVLSEGYEPEMVDEVVEDTAGETTEAEQPEPEPTETAEVTEEPPSSKPTIEPDQFKGYLDEREKRQKLEAELEKLRQQMETQEVKTVDPVDDPQGFKQQMEDTIKRVTFEQDLKWMRRMHPDWEEAESWINEQLGSNVAMAAKLQNSDSLLDDAYQMYQDYKALQELQGANDAKQALEAAQAEIEQLKAQLEGKEVEKKEEVKQAAAQKPSLVTSGTSMGAQVEGHMSLEDLIGSDINHRPK